MTRTPPPFDVESARHRAQNRSTVAAHRGMVCTSQPLATATGLRVLAEGGNCIDAAIAANAVLSVVEPAMCGLGGDLFALVWWEEDRRLYGLNASGRAPAGWSLDEAKRRGVHSIEQVSPLSWTVPGCVDGWSRLSERFGRRPWAELLLPAAEYAEEGFALSPIISTHFDFRAERLPHLARVFQPNGRPPRFGDSFRNPDLARSLREIAERGASIFYSGRIAERIEAKARELGGYLSVADLEAHRSEWVEPLSTDYRGWRVWELPPNGQGVTALQMLNLMERFDLAEMGHLSADHLHLLIEAKRLAFEDRARFLADPAANPLPIEQLISKEYAAERSRSIDLQRAAQTVVSGPWSDSETVYLTVADGAGNMISLIQSIYKGFGSCICPDDVGFPIQNRGEGFSLDPRHPNCLAPGKRPFHTIIPAFVTRDEEPVLSFGVMGGDFQPQGHAQVLSSMLDFGCSPQQAGDAARVEHRGSSEPWGAAGSKAGLGEVVCELGVSSDVCEELARRGHRVCREAVAHGGYQAIWRCEEPRTYFGASDARKDGLALGW
ncbi:MAG: gamma-glutamyltransferase [Acidobacteriota bacterium]